MVILTENTNHFVSFCSAVYLFPFLLVFLHKQALSTVLKSSRDYGHPCLDPDCNGIVSGNLSLTLMCAVGL